MSEEKKVELVVEEKETTKKSSKKAEENAKVEENKTVKTEEPKKEVKPAANVKKEFIVGAKVIDKRKKEYIIHEIPDGELQDQSDIVINCNGVLSVQSKHNLQLV